MMRIQPSIVAAALTLSIVASAEAACEATLPELVMRRGSKPVDIYQTRELMPVSFEELVRDADLVVEGDVNPIATYLTEDQCFLYTDYAVTVREVIHGSPSRAAGPGQSRIVVRQIGGTTTINGVRVSALDRELPPFKAGQHLVLLLSHVPNTQKYEISRAVFGAFEVTNGRIRRMLVPQSASDDVTNVSRDAFVNRILDLKRRR